MQSDEKTKVNFIYKYSDDYNPIYANGAIGGLTPQGEIVANFYFERLPLPKVVEQRVNPEGKLGEVVSTDPAEHQFNIIRFIEQGVIFNLKSAKEFNTWLSKKVQELEQRGQTT